MINDVFIIMPFEKQVLHTADGDRTYSTEHLDDVYQAIVEAVQSFRSTIVVGRMERKHGNLVDAIIRRLAKADVVIAVLAGKNPNVFWELGVRHGLRRGTIMLVEHRDEYPFDLHSYFSHQYSIEHHRDREALKEFIVQRLKELDHETLDDSPVLDVLRKSEIEQFRLLNEWEARRAILMVSGLVDEAFGVHCLLMELIRAAKGAARPDEEGALQPIDAKVGLLDNLIATRPLVGLPQSAYVDATSFLTQFQQFAYAWNSAVESLSAEKLPKDKFYEAVVGSIARLERDLTGLEFDLMNVAEHVMAHKLAVGLPWEGSLRKSRSVIETADQIDQIRTAHFERGRSIQKRLREFESTFVGLPPYVLEERGFAFLYCKDGLPEGSLRFGDFVRTHAKPGTETEHSNPPEGEHADGPAQGSSTGE